MIERRRRGRPDGLVSRRAPADRLLPGVVAAMTLLAALALGGSAAAAAFAWRWQEGAGALVTIQVPQPDAPASAAAVGTSRAAAVLASLAELSQTAAARRLGGDEVAALLRPWLGDAVDTVGPASSGLAVPGVIQWRLSPAAAAAWSDAAAASVADRLQTVAAGTLVETNGRWFTRLATLARSLQACAGACLVLTIGIAAAVVAVATGAALSSRRQAIGIVHGLGATDGTIAGRFARRAALLASAGGAIGTLAAIPVLLGLASVAAPFLDPFADPEAAMTVTAGLPPALWVGLACLPPMAGVTGWLAAQATVRRWLRQWP